MPRGYPNRIGTSREDEVPTPGEWIHAQVEDVPPAPIFEMEKVERSVYKQGQCPWENWVCLDIDGVETGHKFKWVGPVGGTPRCPECGSKQNLPVEAYDINEALRKKRRSRDVDDY